MGTTVTGKNGNRGTDSTLLALPGGMGDAGESVIVADNTPSGYSTVTGKGGRGGDGGNGASPPTGMPGKGSAGGAGGAGGDAAVSAVFSSGVPSVDLKTEATGGAGGSPGTPGLNGPGSAAGKGGSATAKASVTNTFASDIVSALAISVGGQGGLNGGNGQVGGAGGLAFGTSAAAHAVYRATAMASQTGGQGGDATGSARGGAGAASTLTNGVTGSTDGGVLYLRHHAKGGAGGRAEQGAGGAGGAATSSLTFNDATNRTTSIRLTVGAYADGGHGGAGRFGGAGGAGMANNIVTGSDMTLAVAHGRGGDGGGVSSGQTGSGQTGGRGSGSVVTTTTSVNQLAFARSYGVGGRGGTGRGVGQTGGNGGGVSTLARAIAPGQASATAGANGGYGGDGLDGADGGMGAGVALINRVSGVTNGGILRLSQTATSGGGGAATTPSGAQGKGGGAGDASSVLTFNDIIANKTQSKQLVGYSRSVAGAGGAGGKGGAGGNATATVYLTGAGDVSSVAEARGGAGGAGSTRTGGDGGTGGAASASSRAVSTSASGLAKADVLVHGGSGGAGAMAGYAGGKGGDIGPVTASASGFDAEVLVTATAGAGGGGTGGSAGGHGGAARLTDAVSGRATGGSLILKQVAYGGLGGIGSVGGSGGSASIDSRIATRAVDAGLASAMSAEAVAMGGGGGSGKTMGGAGGSAASTVWVAGGSALSVQATATGGAGAGVTDGAGGAGGAATGDASGIGLLRESVTVKATATGGKGGYGMGVGRTGGEGGAANAMARGVGRTVSVTANDTGGAGGAGQAGADGGAGASVSMVNAAGGGSTGGSLTLQQTARGGAGGETSGTGAETATAGAGGSASSHLTLDDGSAGRLSAMTLTGEARATGGAAGVATSDGALGKAGDGDARIALTGKGAVTATSVASGGNAAVRSNTNPAPGVAGAAATAQASASTSSVTSKAIATATANAGNGSVAIGAGNTGGAGGVSSVLTTTATGPVAEATAVQRGGNGGVGLYGAKGGNGADSVIINRVAGQAPGGTLALTQTSVAGAGGEAPGGIGGGGGYALSQLTVDDSAAATGATQLSGRVTAIGGAGGLGSVGTGVGGHDAYGQAGGYAYAQAQLKGRKAVTVDVVVSGGAGGGTTDGDVNGADGGSAGGASIAETTGLTDRAFTRAYLYGGNGGRANGAGRTGGAGGSVGLARAYSTGASATSLLAAVGGRGGAGSGGASGGAGGAVTLTDAVRASVRRGDIALGQAAHGGAGNDGTYGGDAGDAVSSLAFDDTLNPVAARSVTANVAAFGSSGGAGYLGHGAGSDVAASLVLRATNNVVGYASAYGGDSGGGGSGGRSGNATATSKATALGSGATASAYAIARGGLGVTPGTASALSTAETADGALAKANVLAVGANAMGEAAATTHAGDIVTTVTAHAMAARTSAGGEVNAGKLLTGPSVAYDSYVLATASPDAAAIASVVNATANVAAALGSNLTAIVGSGLMGGKSTPLNAEYAGHTDWTLNTTTRSGRLVLALTGWSGAFTNIASLTVRTSVDGVTVTDATFTNTAAAKAYVTDNVLDLGATPVGEAVSVSVSYSIQFAATFSDFAFRYVLAATNTAVSDTIAPLVPSLTIPRADDTGAFDGDRVTNLAQPRLGGIAEPAAFVDIYDGGMLLDTATASLTGGWTYTPTVPLADGKHTLTAIARDAAGNSSAASQALVLEIDTIAPTAPAAPDLLARTDRGRFAADNLTTAGPVSFTGLTDPYHSVEVFDGGTSLGTTVADAAGRWTLDVSTALAGGTHTITVKGTDIAGNTSDASAPLVLTVDAAVTAPAALDLATISETGRALSDDVTRAVQPQIVGTADPGATVRLFDGITLVGSALTDSLGRWRITSAPLADGVHSLVAQASDAAGNVSDTSQALLVTIDTTAPDAPVVTLHNLSDSGTKGDMVTNVVAPTIRGSAEIGSFVTVHDGATLLGSRTVADTGTWLMTLPTMPAGGNILKVTATDAAGNAVTTDVSIEIDVEALPPSAPDLADVSDLGLSSTDDLTGDTTPTFTGSAEARSTVTLLAGSTVLGTGLADLDGKWTITAIAMAPGSHAITARIVDRAGNASVESGATTVTIDVAASAPPDAPDLDAGSDSGASDSDNRTNISSPVFTGTTEAGVTVVLYDRNIEIGRATAGPSGAWSITSAALSDGAHAITARRTNLPGNLSAASAPLTVWIDTAAAPPTVPDLRASQDTGASATDDITRSSTPRFDGKSEANATVILREGTTVIGTGSANAAGAWSVATAVLAEGVHLITAEQVDIAGNASLATLPVSVLIDRTPPSAPTIGAASPLAVGGTAEAFAQVTVYEGAVALGTGLADGSGTWSAAVTLSAGDHMLAVKATDRAGNVSVMSPARAVTVGSGGGDVLFVPGARLMGGGAGDDLYLVDDAADAITEAAGDGSDTVLASVGYTLPAIAAIEFLFADSGAGLALGGNDLVNTIRGGAGADTLTGGGGGDTLMGSGGVDRFRYTALSDSMAGTGLLDMILDFDAAIGETLDLSALDADLTMGGDQAFSFIGTAAFTAAGQVRAETGGGVTLVSGNVNAGLEVDFTIALTGSHTLTGAHFVL